MNLLVLLLIVLPIIVLNFLLKETRHNSTTHTVHVTKRPTRPNINALRTLGVFDYEIDDTDKYKQQLKDKIKQDIMNTHKEKIEYIYDNSICLSKFQEKYNIFQEQREPIVFTGFKRDTTFEEGLYSFRPNTRSA